MSALVEELRQERQLPPRKTCRLIREAAGVSRARLARALGVSRVSVSRWELGQRSPSGDLRRRYTELLLELRDEVGV